MKMAEINVVVAFYRNETVATSLLDGWKAPPVSLEYCDSLSKLERVLPPAQVLIIQGNCYSREVADLLARSKVKLVQSTGAGVEFFAKIGVPKGIIFTNGRGVFTPTIVEQVIGVMLAFARQIPMLERFRQARHWSASEMLPALDVLESKNLVVYGFGDIGRSLGSVAKMFGMNVTGVVSGTSDRDGNGVVTPEETEPYLRAADYLVLTLPLTSKTHGLVDKAFLGRLNPNCILINVCRGKVIDDEALVNALRGKLIRGAALDVFEEEPLPRTSELWGLENVILSPHVAGLGAGMEVKRFGQLIQDNLERFINGKPLRNVVDLSRGF